MGTARWASSSLGLLCLARLAACQYADMADTNYYDQYELYTGKRGGPCAPPSGSQLGAGR